LQIGSSHFILPLAPGLVLFGVDRQLKRVDPRQRDYFTDYLNSHLAVTPWVALPDPLYAFGNKSESGFDMLGALGLRLHQRPQFFLTGDIHHYRRERVAGSLLVTAGGGGAFLHPAPLRHGEIRAEAEFPDRHNSRRLLWQAPWKIALGRSGILPHAVLLVAFWPAFQWSPEPSWSWLLGGAAVVTALGATLALFAAEAHTRWSTRALSFSTAAVMVALPLLLSWAAPLLPFPLLPGWLITALLLLVAVLAGAFAFGTYLALLTLFGLESTQAFTALDHPGFKHFLRLRVRRDGSAVDGYCIGLVDPLSAKSEPVLVDTFTFRTKAP
jgi:hypothetical protein